MIDNAKHLFTTSAGAWLPLAQASITGLILGCSALGLSWLARVRSPWSWGLVIGLLSWAVTWLLLQRHWFSLTNLERLLNLDLDRDGAIGVQQHEAASETIRVRVEEVKQGGDYQVHDYRLPGDRQQLAELAEGVLLHGESFAERAWCGAGRPFSVAGFRALRSEFIKRGLLVIASGKDPRQGFTLTAAGRHVLGGFLEDSPSPAVLDRC